MITRDELRSLIYGPGKARAIAAECGISIPGVYQWIQVGRVPAERVLSVEKAIGVPRHKLRPDIYPPPEGGRVSRKRQ